MLPTTLRYRSQTALTYLIFRSVRHIVSSNIFLSSSCFRLGGKCDSKLGLHCIVGLPFLFVINTIYKMPQRTSEGDMRVVMGGYGYECAWCAWWARGRAVMHCDDEDRYCFPKRQITSINKSFCKRMPIICFLAAN